MNPGHSKDEHIARLLAAAISVVRNELDATLAKFPDLRPSHLRLLDLIGDDGVRITQIAPHAGMTKQALGQFVKYLEQGGYVEVVPDPSDGRANLVRNTKRGRSAVRSSHAAIADVEKRWSEHAGERKYEHFKALLSELAKVER